MTRVRSIFKSQFLISKHLKIKNYKINNSPANSQGVVALITTIVIGLLLVVITTSAAALMANELRQASDFDQSTKAYFAAESGIEDAVAYLRRNGLDVIDQEDGCDTFAGGGITADLDGTNTVAYTCQIVTTKDNKVEGNLGKEAATQIDLLGVGQEDPGFNRIRLSWNRINTDGNAQNFNNSDFTPFDPDDFPAGDLWTQSDGGGMLPAIMEVTVISYPTVDGGDVFDAEDIQKDTIVLRPAGGGTSAIKNFDTPLNQQPVLIDCNSSVDYNCSIILTGFNANRTYLVNLHTRYSPTHYKLEALTGNNTPLDIPNAIITIDVTGKAGSVFRRVQAKAPLNPQSKFPLFTLLADENICKVLEVLNNRATPESGCPIP